MLRSGRELWLASVAIILISFLYIGVVVRTGSIPSASEFFGHSLGVLGFSLMIITEILYSLRKRSRSARWGRTSVWLQFHIFTGIVGPYLVLLHSSWKFNGLAGVVTLLTLVVAGSGFIGRYIYTAIPRSADGAMLEASQLEQHIAATEVDLQRLAASSDAATVAYAQHLANISRPSTKSGAASMIFGRAFSELRIRLDAWRYERKMRASERPYAIQLDELFKRRRSLHRQINTIATARQLLSVWHTVHIPLGVALFTTAIFHVGAAIYYATLLH